MNTEARLKLELSEAQIEIQRLRERLTTTPPPPIFPQGSVLGFLGSKMVWLGISHLARGIFLEHRELS